MMVENTSSEVRTVTAIALEMRQSIIQLAGDRAVFDSRDRWLERAARAAGISRRMAKALFYTESHNPGWEVVEKVRNAIKRERGTGNDELGGAAKSEYQKLLMRIERLEAALRVSDPEFHGVDIDGLRGVRGADSGPVDK